MHTLKEKGILQLYCKYVHKLNHNLIKRLKNNSDKFIYTIGNFNLCNKFFIIFLYKFSYNL